jgi:hypothetical protein
MDPFRTRLVTDADEKFIRSADDTQSRWVIQNLGPAKVVVTGYHVTGTSTNVLRAGDYLDLKCQSANVNLAQNESYNASILQWMPVP